MACCPVENTETINLTDTASVLTADVNISAASGNNISIHADGLYSTGNTEVNLTDTDTIDLTLTGSIVTADVNISADAGNIITTEPDGLFAQPPASPLDSGQATLAADFNITGTLDVWLATGMSILLPSAGTYLVSATFALEMNLNHQSSPTEILAEFYDLTNLVDLPDTVIYAASCNSAAGIIEKYGTSMSSLITILAPITLGLSVKRRVSTGCKVLSNSTGNVTRMEYVKVF